MRKTFSWICGILAALASEPAGASAAAPEPDFNLAYVLATASYCAYAVGAIDSDGEKLADQGRERAVDCLMAAVEADPGHLDVLKVEAADVEAYFSPAKPQNVYLLIHAKNGVILAFRGTLTPPISPGKASRVGLVKEAIENYNADVLKSFESYLRDWVNNVVAFANERHRHAGFDASWQELKEHLKIDCAPGATEACSKFRSFLTQMRAAAPDQHLFVTGHSKGGALATLAALDIAELVQQAPETTVYTFAAAKSLSQDGAKNAVSATADLWRFENEGDVVPTLPLDETAFPVTIEVPFTGWKMTPYAHVGRRVLFGEDKKPVIFPEPANGPDAPGDLQRLKAILRGGAEPAANASDDGKGLIDRILSTGADGCRRFVDSHFSIFSSVQEMNWAGDEAQPGASGGGEAAGKRHFFFSGVANADGEILWGYGQWCSVLYPPK